EADHAAEGAAAPRPEAAALAVSLGRGAGKLAPEAAEFLRKSGALLDLQMEHLHEERHIHHRHLQLRYFGDRLRVALQLLAVAGGAAIAIVLAAVAWSAHNDRSLVVEAFSAPPDLAQRGVSGRLLANLLLDRLKDMEAHAQSIRAPASYVDSWSGESRVEIPETGISLTEIDRLLHRWLGHQTHITGDAYLNGQTLVVAARVGDKPAKSFSGEPAEVQVLVGQAAEAIYASTQPYRYASFLSRTGRFEEARAAYRELAESRASPTERAWGYTGLANRSFFSGDVGGAERQARKALQLMSSLALAQQYLALAEAASGRDQDALADARAARAAYVHARNNNITSGGAAYQARRLEALAAEITGDYAAAARIIAAQEGGPDYNAGARISPCKTIEDLALAHDAAGARQRLADWGVGDDAAAMPASTKAGMICLPGWALARGDSDWAGGLADLTAADQAAATAGPVYATLRVTGLTPWLAYARMKTGDLAAARAFIATTPADCYLCLRVRAQIAEAGHDRTAADGWFARAAGAAPSLPFAYFERGEALAARGDLKGAAVQFARAHELSPAFADPLQAWGEVLARQGDRAGAIAKYRQAAVAAPHWARPHLFSAQVLTGLGQSSDAAKELQLARTLT
ncbi:MAG: hypothetical protein ACXWKM_09775, partial [Phenylobacterium sp.]